MKDQPQLLVVPHFFEHLNVRADHNGITVLKPLAGRWKKRYTGSKAYEVTINGELVTRKGLQELLNKDRPAPGKKKAPPTKGTPDIKANHTPETKVEKTYRINKPEIRARLYSYIAAQPHKKNELYFWTVTFPMKTSDETIYKLFNTWLTKLRTKNLLRQYLWVAERQKNGTLHFHIAIPHKMPAKTANREMMVCLCNASKAGEIDYNLHACKRYNGVDISKNRNNRTVTNFACSKRGKRALTNYITKYITKNDGHFTHLAWHNSRGFSMLFTGVTFTYDESRNKYKWRFYTTSKPAIENEYFTYYPWINGPPPNLEGELFKLNTFIQNLN